MYTISSNSGKLQRIIRLIIDILNVIIGVATVVLAILAFIYTGKNMWMFPVIFLLGGIMNGLTGLKYFITDKKIAGIVAEVFAMVLFVVCYMSYMAIGG